MAAPVHRRESFPCAAIAAATICAISSIALFVISYQVLTDPEAKPGLGVATMLAGNCGLVGSGFLARHSLLKWYRSRRDFDLLEEEEISDSALSVAAPTPLTQELHVYDPEAQLARFTDLDLGSRDNHILDVDQFNDILPSTDARVLVTSGPTNGALIWDRIIMIQGPHTPFHHQLMEQIVDEHNIQAVVRVGPFAYPPYDQISTAALFAIDEWPDHGITDLQPIYDLIQELEQYDGKIMVHCRGGAGRTGVFVACWRIYQLHKAGEGEVDPAAIVEEMRQHRYGMVQTAPQFNMILRFVEHLNTQNAA